MTTRTRGKGAAAAPRPAQTQQKPKAPARDRHSYDAAVYLGPRGEVSEKPTKSAQMIADREAARRAKK